MMFELTRTVRFSVPIDGEVDVGALRAQPRDNTFAGWPSMVGLGLFCELHVTYRGAPDAASGFVVDIGDVDDAVRRRAVPLVADAIRARTTVDPAELLVRIVDAMRDALAVELRRIVWPLTPHYRIAVECAEMDRIEVRQQFEFAASHRLHLEALGAEANRNLFGKCNNPNGHGHNYRLEVAVSKPLRGDGRPSLQDIEHVVRREIVDRFDHTHLNLDTPEFSELNPTVEHIAKVCFDLADDPVSRLGGRLEEVTVWETDKTSCTYRPAATGR